MPDPTTSGSDETRPAASDHASVRSPFPPCPVCRGPLVEVRGKLQCTRCHAICETCCEGGPPEIDDQPRQTGDR